MPVRKAWSSTGEPPRKRSRPEYVEIDEDEEENVIDCSQNPGFVVSDDTPEAGIIERVVLKNFLCHNIQDIIFGPRVNFIIGNNGSGKSAVMTAVVVGLGGKATAANRGHSVKNFVKWGKNSAEVSIHLRNQGQDAYKPELYGKTIIVQRKISRDGIHGPYRLRNASGGVVSHKKEELANILDQFNIQVDNPVSLLNQETCKNFLHSKSGHDKYMFFMRATQLEQMKQDYTNANQFKDRAKDTLKVKLEELPGLEREVKIWEEKFKAFDAIAELRKKVENLKDEMAWAIVTEKERALDPIKKEARIQEARTPKFVARVQDKEKEVSECIAKKADIERRMKEMSSQAEELTPRHHELKAAKDDRKKSFKLKQAEVASLEKELARTRRDKDSTAERIKEIQNRNEKDCENNKRKREEKLEKLDSQLREHEDQLATTEHVLGQFKAAVAKCKADITRARNDEKDLSAQKEQYAREIRELQSTRTNKLRRFGQHMPELVKQIEQAASGGLFHQKPRGPIGARVNLKEPRWAVAVEVCLEGLVTAFCVHDHHDERQLEKLMRQVLANNRKPLIITSKFTSNMYDVSNNKAVSRFPTVLDMIDLKSVDPVIINTLIDQKGIENILLIETSAKTCEVLSKNPPKNVKMAFTMEGDQAHCHPTFRYYSLPQEKTSSILTSNLEESINVLKRKHGELDRVWKGKQQEVKEKDEELRENTRQERSHQTDVHKLRDQIARLTFEINDLKATAEDESAADVTPLEDDMARLDEHIESVCGRLEAHKTKLAHVKEQYDSAEKAFNEVDDKMRKITTGIDPVQEELGGLQDALELAKKHRKYYEDKRKEHEKKVKELQKELDAHEKDVMESTAKAEAICPRKKTRRTPQNIESEIIQIEKRINAEEKSRGNREEIFKKYTSTYEAFVKIKRDVNQNQNLLEQLDEVMAIREQNFFHFRKIIALRAKYFFITSLNHRKFTGKLSFDHHGENLTLFVQPSKESQQASSSKDVRSLSGGERSFSTVCFVLALWDAIESPFRMLDEFDVFMDMVNRRVSMDMLIEATGSELNKRRQFIFLTPQDTTLIPSSNLRILRMRAPERGQTTLDFRPDGSQSEAGSAPGEDETNEEEDG